ncbi:MAG: GvpL/GvpF family gas vesicle protein [Bacillota bacterium]
MNSDLEEKNCRYMYCVVKGNAEELGLRGIDNENVFTLSYGEVTVVTHRCMAEPYYSGDDEVVKGWVKDHHRIVEEYWLKYGNVVPFTFNTIIKGDGGVAPEELLFKWLVENYEYIQGRLTLVEGCKEYGVQIIMDSKKAAEMMVDSDEEIVRLREELDSATPGKGFLIKEKINARLKRLVEKEADNVFRSSYSSIEKIVKRVCMEKIKKVDRQKVMLLNVNCLANEEQCAELGWFLERINGNPHLEVIFSGPWPPYSFM